MPITLGILAQSRQAVAASDFVLLETTVLSSPQASVEFTSLGTKYSSTYKHLQIRLVASGSRSGAGNDPLFIQFNSSGGSAYASHGLVGSGSTVFSEANTSAAQMERIGNIGGSTAGTDVFGANVVDILDAFQTTKNKTVRVLGGGAYAANPVVGLWSGFWNNTAAVTSIKLSNFSGTSFITNSRFSLYGVKG